MGTFILAIMKKVPITAWLAIGAFGLMLTWTALTWMENQQLSTQVTLYKGLAEKTEAIQELREDILNSNNLTLRDAINSQNEQFKQLMSSNNQVSDLILFRLNDQNKLTERQYKEMNAAIQAVNINSCEDMVSALVGFGATNRDSWAEPQ